MAGAATHFEIYADQPANLARFFRSLLGRQIAQAHGIDYRRIQAQATRTGGFRGGLTCRPFPGLCSRLLYVPVEPLDETPERVQRPGGKRARLKSAVPGTARYAVVEDPEGNIFALYQPDPTAFPPPEPDV